MDRQYIPVQSHYVINTRHACAVKVTMLFKVMSNSILCGEHVDENQSFLDHIARCIPPELEYTVTEAMIRYVHSPGCKSVSFRLILYCLSFAQHGNDGIAVMWVMLVT